MRGGSWGREAPSTAGIAGRAACAVAVTTPVIPSQWEAEAEGFQFQPSLYSLGIPWLKAKNTKTRMELSGRAPWALVPSTPKAAGCKNGPLCSSVRRRGQQAWGESAPLASSGPLLKPSQESPDSEAGGGSDSGGYHTQRGDSRQTTRGKGDCEQLVHLSFLFSFFSFLFVLVALGI